MASAHHLSNEPPTRPAPRSSVGRLAHAVKRDPVLLGAFLVVGIVLLYQLVVTLLQPVWVGAVTDWLRAGLAWPALLVMVLVGWHLTRLERPEARSWWLLSIAFLSYAVARTFWTIDDRFVFPNRVPFPTYPDLFFLLQYPFFLLALLLLPGAPPWAPRVRVILDCLLLMGAASALSWYLLLEPIYLHSRENLPGKLTNLTYPLGDLCLLFGLTVALVYRRCLLARAVLTLLIVSTLCLVMADSWAALELVFPHHTFTTGHPPDLFWMAFYLLVPLAGVVLVRLLPRPPSGAHAPSGSLEEHQLPLPSVRKETVSLLLPFAAALVAGIIIGVGTLLDPTRPRFPLAPSLVICGLFALVLARQGVTLAEQAALRREREEARTRELAAEASEARLREVNQQLKTFLGIVTHELKTPLTSILMGMQLLHRRLERSLRHQTGAGEQEDQAVVSSLGVLELTMQQLGRLNRLVNDLVDFSRIQRGQLEIQLQPADLVAVVEQTILEQRQAAPERTLRLSCPPRGTVPVLADAERLGQVVINYLTNALKYSEEAAPVEVGVQVEGQHGRVWVRDQGPGIVPTEQPYVWEQFHRVPGVEVQSGSGIGLGLGLHISKTIIEHHQGRVGVESTPGAGATFWFTLPLAPAGVETPGAQEGLPGEPSSPV